MFFIEKFTGISTNVKVYLWRRLIALYLQAIGGKNRKYPKAPEQREMQCETDAQTLTKFSLESAV